MIRVLGELKDYDWGSREALAALTSRPAPTARPEAELWFGAHEGGPSPLADGEGTLLDVVRERGEQVLGAEVHARFGGRLPFLMKVLAPVRALSIQAHPNAEQACNAEDGVYADDWPKPEALFTLTRFEVFAGTVAPARTRELAQAMGATKFAALVEEVQATHREDRAALLQRLIHLEGPQRDELVQEVSHAATTVPQDPHLAAVARVARDFPADPGILLTLVMNHHALNAGEYVFVPAGVLHSYQYGVAVEILANSDNVVRAGLTPKKVDIDELVRIVDVERQMAPESGAVEGPWTVFPADTPYFRLRVAKAASHPAVPATGEPRILMAVNGSATLVDGTGEQVLSSGEAAFLAAGDQVAVTAGDAQLFLASPGSD
ncbi:mannose-6-phosphate isomerase, class I [Dermacoccaceae bacterium W4C1]